MIVAHTRQIVYSPHLSHQFRIKEKMTRLKGQAA